MQTNKVHAPPAKSKKKQNEVGKRTSKKSSAPAQPAKKGPANKAPSKRVDLVATLKVDK